MAIELLKLTRVAAGSPLSAVLRTFDLTPDDVRELFELRAPTRPNLCVVDDQLDAVPATSIMPMATDLQRVDLAMWLGGTWVVYELVAVVVDNDLYVDQPQWNVISGMRAFDD